MHTKRERLVLQLEFDFSTYAHPKLARREPGGYRRNVLLFKKESFAPGRIDRAMDRFYRKYMPPVIPLYGGFFVDFVRLYQIIDEWNDPDPDTLREHRLGQLREKMDAALRARASGLRER